MALQGPEDIRAYYADAEVVARYLERRTGQPLNGALHGAQVRLLRKLIIERAPRRVLEIAPGPGRLTAELTLPGTGLAIEFSDTMLAAAGSRVAPQLGWRLVRGDAFQLPVADACIDLAFSFRFVRRFELANRERLYAEFRRVLRAGGGLILDAQNRAVALPHRQQRGLNRYPVFDQLYDRSELEEELQTAGFRVVRVEGMIMHFALQRLLNRLRRVSLDRVARALIASLEYVPGKNPSTWIVMCEKRG